RDAHREREARSEQRHPLLPSLGAGIRRAPRRVRSRTHDWIERRPITLPLRLGGNRDPLRGWHRHDHRCRRQSPARDIRHGAGGADGRHQRPHGALFANDYTGDKSFLIDFSSPTAPRLHARLDRVPNGRRLHSFARLPNGHVLATVQFGDSTIAGQPGGIAEFDADGHFLRSGWSRDSTFPGARIRTYGLTLIPALDRVVTTSAPMDAERTANVVQVWRLSDLRLLKTLPVPRVAGDSAEEHPFEVRTLADGSVMMNTYYCGFFHITDIGGDPKIARVLALPEPRDFGCSVPVMAGHFLVMPIAYAHRYATIDIADADHPKEIASLPTDSAFFPHWAALDPGSDRVVFTDQGDGKAQVRVAHLDRATGRLSWDDGFKDAGAASPGISYDRSSWPNGVKGMAMPHGAVFVP